ncbi:hypothetical protein B0A54_17522 [Friedmanniomyces endolithicus]|uniref:NadR/Ttd14 AAA domain-containing protein n=1 Tax=Friedmanniomyces endolithicus TaxID=329885 RepID=A0A4U0TX19_9PEZI|nr:hypothetical protein LTS09_017508 [Friedmanniomyces endolithicus]TKA26536.1 hypothetical protein B0A54_17522 [Friedmanniomyces endolithicus]
MPRNIFIVGPQCAGKTTLIQALEQLFPLPGVADEPVMVINEVVRDVMSANGFSSHDIGSDKWDQLQALTLEAQCHAEEALNGRWFVSDRSGIDPIIYAQLGRQSKQKLLDTKHWKASRQRMQDGLVIMCEAGNLSWLSSDAVRLNYTDSVEWEALNKHFIKLLEQEHIRFVVLQKDVVCMKERLDFVVAKLIAYERL